jgi:hypothetical protein
MKRFGIVILVLTSLAFFALISRVAINAYKVGTGASITRQLENENIPFTELTNSNFIKTQQYIELRKKSKKNGLVYSASLVASFFSFYIIFSHFMAFCFGFTKRLSALSNKKIVFYNIALGLFFVAISNLFIGRSMRSAALGAIGIWIIIIIAFVILFLITKIIKTKMS